MKLEGDYLFEAKVPEVWSALFDPVILAIAFLVAWPRYGAKAAGGRVATLLTVTVALLGAALLIGGRDYAHGVTMTTLGRVAGPDSALSVLADAWTWTGLITAASAGLSSRLTL